jgi:hypothetical protein
MWAIASSPLKKGTSIFSGCNNTAKMWPEKKNVPFFNALLGYGLLRGLLDSAPWWPPCRG